MGNWEDVLNEIASKQSEANTALITAVDSVRRNHHKKLSNYVQRNVIAYYSGWFHKPSNLPACLIDQDDLNGFMRVTHGLDKSKGLDLIVHTCGGDIAATVTIIQYLRNFWGDDIRAIIPQTSMSGGTMIALSCNEIIMGKHSSIGPIDPQINGVPAIGIIEEFKKAHEEIKADKQKLNVWLPILNKYSPTLIDTCERAIKWSTSFTKDVLAVGMLSSNRGAINQVIDRLTSHEHVKNHNQPIHIDEAKQLGLSIRALEDDQTLQDLVLTLHHCFMHTFNQLDVAKIIENNNHAAFIRIINPSQ